MMMMMIITEIYSQLLVIFIADKRDKITNSEYKTLAKITKVTTATGLQYCKANT